LEVDAAIIDYLQVVNFISPQLRQNSHFHSGKNVKITIFGCGAARGFCANSSLNFLFFE